MRNELDHFLKHVAFLFLCYHANDLCMKHKDDDENDDDGNDENVDHKEG